MDLFVSIKNLLILDSSIVEKLFILNLLIFPFNNFNPSFLWDMYELVLVNSNSLESKASDPSLPEYIFEGPGEVLLIKGDYFQVRWRRPVPDVWINSDHIVSY